jgi:hypothetical protein
MILIILIIIKTIKFIMKIILIIIKTNILIIQIIIFLILIIIKIKIFINQNKNIFNIKIKNTYNTNNNIFNIKTLIPTDLSIAITKELMLVLVNLTPYLLIYFHIWFGFVSKTEFCCSSTRIRNGMKALD